MKPQIVSNSWEGFNHRPEKIELLAKGKQYQDLSTICIVPSRGVIAAKVVQNWMSLITPMNNRFIRMFAVGMEVGEAYSSVIEQIVNHPELSKWRYILTLEDDVMIPPDGLLKLYESLEGGVDGKKYDVIGGLYFTKGAGGQPMIYGNPKDMPLSFRPQVPTPETVQPACGLGMGFNLFRMAIFKDKELPRPWFKTLQHYQPGIGSEVMTQDLYFYQNAGKLGYKFACDTRVRCGHYDIENDIVW